MSILFGCGRVGVMIYIISRNYALYFFTNEAYTLVRASVHGWCVRLVIRVIMFTSY